MLLGLQRVSHVPRQPQTVNTNPYINEAWGRRVPVRTRTEGISSCESQRAGVAVLTRCTRSHFGLSQISRTRRRVAADLCAIRSRNIHTVARPVSHW